MPPSPADRDKDGMLDADDACPDVPGVKTNDPKTNGCPPSPPDRDKDGVLDADDACPDVPGVKTDDPRPTAAPPPPDRDKDGILDNEDACPDVPGTEERRSEEERLPRSAHRGGRDQNPAAGEVQDRRAPTSSPRATPF